MRVLFLATAFPRHDGDVITPWLVEAGVRLQRRGVEVEVLAPSFRGLRSHRHEGLLVHRFRYAPSSHEDLTHEQTTPDRLRGRPSAWALVPPYLLAGAVRAVSLAGSFDVLHAFWPLPHALMALPAKRLRKVPLVSSFFGVELRWNAPLRDRLLSLAVAGSDRVTAISSDTAEALRRLVPGADPAVIPFGAAVDVDASVASPKAPGAGLRVLFVGRLVERKGVGVLLRALASLPPDVTLDVVGDGPLRGALVQEGRSLGAGGRLRFHGFVPKVEKERLLAACDVLVLPAVRDEKGDQEGLGVVLLEAMAFGKPVVASRLGGIPDVVEDGESGLLSTPGDPASLSAALSRLRADGELRTRLGEAGRRRVGERFSWDVVTEKLVEIYRSVLPAF